MELQEMLFWLWRASWQASVLVLLILVAQWVFKARLAPKWRYALWLLVVARLALPVTPETPVSIFNLAQVDAGISPSAGSTEEAVGTEVPEWFALAEREWGERHERFGAEEPEEAPDASGVGETEGRALPAGATHSGETSVGFPHSWGTVHILGGIWLAGVLFFTGRLIVGNLWFARRLRGRPPVTDPRALDIFDRCAEEMGVGKRLVLVETPDVEGPALFGVFRLKLLLPSGMVNRLSDEELRYVFLHELAHVRRRDVAVNWLVAILHALHWFNPVLWLGFRRMRIDRELACDALALSCVRAGENTGYGRTILKVLEGFNRPVPVSGLVGILEGRSGMKMRMQLIARFRRSRRWSVLAASVFAVLAVVALTDRSSGGAEAAPVSASTSGEEEAMLNLRVVNATTGQPLGGMEIQVNYCDDRACHSLGSFETSGDGEAEIAYPVANLTSLTVYAVHPNFAPVSVNWEPPEEQVPERHVVELVGGAIAGGVIHDEAGRPVEGAKVDLALSGSRQEPARIRPGTMVATTDADGRWRVSGIPEPYENLEITVTHPDFPPQDFLTVQNENRWTDPVRLEMAELAAGNAAMELQRGYRIEGRVVDAGGDPIEEAKVRLGLGIFAGDRQTMLTEADGRFAFRWLGYRETKLFGERAGYGPVVRDIPAAHEALDLELRLPPGREVSVTVADADGDPLPEASVIPGDWKGHTFFDWRGRTDDEGHFTWSSAPEDPVSFSIGKAGYVRARDRELTPGEENVVVLERAARIVGRVTDAETGEPIEVFGIRKGQYVGDTRVFWSSSRRTVEQEEGLYELTPSEPLGSPMALRLEADGYQPSVSGLFQLAEGELVVNFSLEKLVPMTGRVLSPDGVSLPGVEVALLTPNSRTMLGAGRFIRRNADEVGAGDFTETDSQGRFSLVPDPEARMILFVHEQGYAEFSTQEPIDLDEVRLQRWGRIEGEAIIGGEPAASVYVGSLYAYTHNFIRYDESDFRTDVGEDGRFTIDRVPPGWRSIHPSIQVGSRRSMSHRDYIEVEPGGVTEIRLGGNGPGVVGQLAIDDPDLDVDWQAGYVSLRTERPRPPDTSDLIAYHTWAKLDEVRRALEEVRRFAVAVEPDGAFRVEDVPPGNYELSVTAQTPDEDPSGGGRRLGSLTREVTVPETTGDQPHDLGEIVVAVDMSR